MRTPSQAVIGSAKWTFLEILDRYGHHHRPLLDLLNGPSWKYWTEDTITGRYLICSMDLPGNTGQIRTPSQSVIGSAKWTFLEILDRYGHHHNTGQIRTPSQSIIGSAKWTFLEILDRYGHHHNLLLDLLNGPSW
ncbi:Hypothetical predicted protein [Pelobates cultripes]|uniref:Uncharacterized protein n=1 Tax=Pelobates cultripes TaxID=61616 RepID=A0AAD1WXL3_PELCU|nr:Hypothetical predicted protein [Pelobates cultripes]